ncbi:MAG: chloride channel protein [Bryobacterales bacterium]|nr:chloride channel protein [Bryobacterales bacterium]MBV9399625.1 chloride channel protein [Bryobacterales bacterium]
MQVALVLSLVIGALVGLVTVAFILLTGRLGARMYPVDSGWRRVLVPTLGSLVTGFLLWRFFPFARGSGIPQTKFALFINDGRITFRTVLGKFFCCSASLASGIALGREGPSVQVGAGLASVLARNAGLSTEQVKALVPVGCSAALAAAFNTPIAGVLFSLEEIMGDLHASVLGTAVVASATSWMVLHLVLGDDPLFHVPAYKLVHPVEFGVYAVLGVIGGLGSVAFVKLLLKLRQWFTGMPRWSVWLQPVVGGLGVGIMGYFVPEVMGVGYTYVDKILNGDVVLKLVIVLAVLKIMATALCYGSGNAGGIFGPSLFIGATIGAAVGSVAHTIFPGQTAGPGAYALVGMGTAFAGIVRTPMTSVIMIFEVTRDYAIIVPLMISNLIAFFISYRLQRTPIYEALALQDGVHLPEAATRAKAGWMRVSQAMRQSPAILSAEMPTRAAMDTVNGNGALDAWPVLDSQGLQGMIRTADLVKAVSDGAANTRISELLNAMPDSPHVHPDHTLGTALERMGSADLHVLPVVSRANVRQLVGIVVLEDILAAFGVARPAANRAEK